MTATSAAKTVTMIDTSIANTAATTAVSAASAATKR